MSKVTSSPFQTGMQRWGDMLRSVLDDDLYDLWFQGNVGELSALAMQTLREARKVGKDRG